MDALLFAGRAAETRALFECLLGRGGLRAHVVRWWRTARFRSSRASMLDLASPGA
jgi:hypothetical protein